MNQTLIYFNDRKHPKDLGTGHISTFLTHSAVQRKVAGFTQNQTLSAPAFLYKTVYLPHAPERKYYHEKPS